MPMPLWVVPNAARGVISRAWVAVGPDGHWCITTDAHRPGLHDAEWNAGQQGTGGLLDGWGVS